MEKKYVAASGIVGMLVAWVAAFSIIGSAPVNELAQLGPKEVISNYLNARLKNGTYILK